MIDIIQCLFVKRFLTKHSKSEVEIFCTQSMVGDDARAQAFAFCQSCTKDPSDKGTLLVVHFYNKY